jgi:Holliday junction resolvase-like predicted endonuclease
MTDAEFRSFMADLAREFNTRLADLDERLETKSAASNAQYAARLAKSEAQYAARLAESEAQYRARLAESEAQYRAGLAESDARFTAMLTESHQRLETQLAKTDAQLAKTDAQLAKTDAQLKKLSKLFGDVNNNRGEVAEEFFFRSLEKKPQIGHLKFHTVHRNLNATQGKIEDEFDLVLVNGDSLAIIEVKTKAHPELVDKMLAQKIPHLRTLFPQFRALKIYAGIASLVSYHSLVEAASKKGLFLLTQQGKHIELVSENLVPMSM